MSLSPPQHAGITKPLTLEPLTPKHAGRSSSLWRLSAATLVTPWPALSLRAADARHWAPAAVGSVLTQNGRTLRFQREP